MSTGAIKDIAGNNIAALTNAGNIFVSYGPPTLITLDGRFDPSEWPNCTVAVADSFDSQWNASASNITNEIQTIDATWDSTYLYLGVRGVVTANSWILYLDTDPNGPNGQADLRNINAWARGAQFTAPGFKPDWELGAYQHQGQFDSQTFFKILSATTTANYSDSILKAFDPAHNYGLNGGSELAIPWSVLYGLGIGRVPANARLGLVASLAYDPEPTGRLGGDQAPSNISSVAPILDNRTVITLDANGDGFPDPIDRTAPALVSAMPAPNDTVITLQFNEPLFAATANQATRYTVYQTSNPTATLNVVSATLQANGTTVVIVVSPMAYVPYSVAANGVSDASCFHNAGQTTTSFQGPPVAVDPTAATPHALELATPWPNPSPSGKVTFEYRLPGGPDSHVRDALRLYDLGGRKLRTLVDGAQMPGIYRIAFDGADERGHRLAPGLYFVRVSVGASQQTKRLVIMP